MAIHVKCEHCGHTLNAPDDMKGKKVECPNCGNKTLVVSQIDREVMEAQEKKKAEELRKQREEDAKRLALIEAAEQAKRTTMPTEDMHKTHFDSSQPSQYNSLRVMGSVLVFTGYLMAILSIGYGLHNLIGLSEGSSVREGLINFLIYFVAALVIFVVCKFAGEISRALADIADNDANVVRLMQDLYEHFSRSGKK